MAYGTVSIRHRMFIRWEKACQYAAVLWLAVATRRQHRDRRLSSQDWIEAALAAIADGGLNAVAVEPLAKALGVTKGSFYAHFPNRAALVEAALQSWQRSHGHTSMAVFSTIADPAERLRSLLLNALEFSQSLAPSVHVSLLGELHDDRVRAAVHEVTTARMGLITQTYLELGLPEEQAEHRARLGYAAYTGMLFLARENPGNRLHGPQLASFLHEVDSTLISASTPTAHTIEGSSAAGHLSPELPRNGA